MPQELRAQIAAEARAAYPQECCGLIEGVREHGAARALAVHPTANYSPEPDAFEIDPAAHLRLLRTLRGTGREIVGCYHSHPGGGPTPSIRDRENGGTEDIIWVIAALTDPAAAPSFSAYEGLSFRELSLTEQPALEVARPRQL